MPLSHEDSLAGLRQVWDAFAVLIPTIADDEWARRTPCPDWDVHDLVAHLGAVEGGFQGFPRVSPPDGWVNPKEGLDAFTEAGVVARRSWSHAEVGDEALRAGRAQIERLAALDEDGWRGPATGPLGPTTQAGLADIRLFDLGIHLYDLRGGLGRPLDVDAEPLVLACSVQRAVDLAGWGAAKKARLADGARVLVELNGPGARTFEIVLDGGKARIGDTDPAATPTATVRAHAAALALLAAGRPGLADELGGVQADGPDAEAFVEKYRFFG
jgi:uncharacterized protein (TIGR03083 family)